jgi:hypothetical protein
MSQTGIEPGPLRWEAALAKSYSNSILIAIQNIYIRALDSHIILLRKEATKISYISQSHVESFFVAKYLSNNFILLWLLATV